MKLDRLLKIGKYEVDRHGMSDMQILLLALAIDPSEKQKQVLDAFDIKIFDFNGKSIYPSEKKTMNSIKAACSHQFESDGGCCIHCHKSIRELMDEQDEQNKQNKQD
jgi:hypothetical protein